VAGHQRALSGGTPKRGVARSKTRLWSPATAHRGKFADVGQRAGMSPERRANRREVPARSARLSKSSRNRSSPERRPRA
jgi:hypothetical protein